MENAVRLQMMSNSRSQTQSPWKSGFVHRYKRSQPTAAIVCVSQKLEVNVRDLLSLKNFFFTITHFFSF
jgi:hypothetical protein